MSTNTLTNSLNKNKLDQGRRRSQPGCNVDEATIMESARKSVKNMIAIQPSIGKQDLSKVVDAYASIIRLSHTRNPNAAPPAPRYMAVRNSEGVAVFTPVVEQLKKMIPREYSVEDRVKVSMELVSAIVHDSLVDDKPIIKLCDHIDKVMDYAICDINGYNIRTRMNSDIILGSDESVTYGEVSYGTESLAVSGEPLDERSLKKLGQKVELFLASKMNLGGLVQLVDYVSADMRQYCPDYYYHIHDHKHLLGHDNIYVSQLLKSLWGIWNSRIDYNLVIENGTMGLVEAVSRYAYVSGYDQRDVYVDEQFVDNDLFSFVCRHPIALAIGKAGKYYGGEDKFGIWVEDQCGIYFDRVCDGSVVFSQVYSSLPFWMPDLEDIECHLRIYVTFIGGHRSRCFITFSRNELDIPGSVLITDKDGMKRLYASVSLLLVFSLWRNQLIFGAESTLNMFSRVSGASKGLVDKYGLSYKGMDKYRLPILSVGYLMRGKDHGGTKSDRNVLSLLIQACLTSRQRRISFFEASDKIRACGGDPVTVIRLGSLLGELIYYKSSEGDRMYEVAKVRDELQLSGRQIAILLEDTFVCDGVGNFTGSVRRPVEKSVLLSDNAWNAFASIYMSAAGYDDSSKSIIYREGVEEISKFASFGKTLSKYETKGEPKTKGKYRRKNKPNS